MQKIKNLEFLRVVFMLSVLWMHLTARLNSLVNSDLLNMFRINSQNGGKAVEGFFIISGFLLYITFKQEVTITEFIKKKFVRLSPVIIFTLALGFIASCFGLINFSMHSAIMTATFTNILANMNVGNWNCVGVTWFVSVLFWVSLLYFCIRKFTGKTTTANLIIGLLTIISYYLVLHVHNGSLGSPLETYFGIFNVGLLRGFGGIGLGYFLGTWFKDNYTEIQNKIVTTKGKLLYTIAEITLMLAVISELFVINSPHKYNFSIVILIFMLITLFVIRKGYLSQLLNKDWCVFLGRYTYSIYITHILFFILMEKLIKFSGELALIPTILLPIIFGVLVYHFVEVPAGKYLKKKLLN